MQEKIGQVTIDDTFYPGEDLYCDGEIEDTLLRIVKEHPAEEYDRIIAEAESWPVLYHLSAARGNIVSWIPMEKEAKVLEVGSGCGAITGTLAGKAKSVTCVDLSKKRSTINAYRNKAYENVQIYVGNFKDIEPSLAYDYDFVMLIGVFEYGQAYIGGERPYEEFMEILLRHLKPDGHLVIAIENKFGLKYWAGCREDHLGTYFSGLEDYKNGGGVRTFTRNGLEKILKAAGVAEYDFYYPYPDYKFMHTLYSDRRLPKEGELSTNRRNFDMDRLELFDEQAVFDTVLREGEFPLFSNSYLVITGGVPSEQGMRVSYSKFSNERDGRFCIRTDILETEDGRKYAVKYPLTKEAKGHVSKINESYERLSAENRMPWMHFAPPEPFGEGMRFPFLQGKTFQETLRQKIEAHREGEAKVLLLDFIGRFRQYEAERKPIAGLVPLTDLDFVFSNIIVNGDDWHMIDYEWSFAEEIPKGFVLFRTLFRAGIELPKCALTEPENLFLLAGIACDEAEEYYKMEQKFQNYISGGKVPLRDMAELFGKQVIPLVRDKSAAEQEAAQLINLYGMRAGRLFYSIDKAERFHGKAIVSGWACAKVRGYGYIPADITIYDEDGNTMEQAVRRLERPDVMEVLKAKGRKADGCGFEAVFSAGMRRKYTIRFSAGRCQKEAELFGK